MYVELKFKGYLCNYFEKKREEIYFIYQLEFQTREVISKCRGATLAAATTKIHLSKKQKITESAHFIVENFCFGGFPIDVEPSVSFPLVSRTK